MSRIIRPATVTVVVGGEIVVVPALVVTHIVEGTIIVPGGR